MEPAQPTRRQGERTTMNTQQNSAMHPSLRRTTAALAVVGARQQLNAIPAALQTVLAIGLSLAAIAAVAFS